MSPASPSPLRTCRVELTLDLTAPRTARNLVDLLLPQWGVTDSDALDGAALVLSELVTHCLIRSDDGGPVTVGVDLREDGLQLWVLDRSPAVPAQRAGSDDARGLVIVGQIAARWGVQREARGLRAFADVPLLPAAAR